MVSTPDSDLLVQSSGNLGSIPRRTSSFSPDAAGESLIERDHHRRNARRAPIAFTPFCAIHLFMRRLPSSFDSDGLPFSTLTASSRA
jgi:hypothetical protein